MTGLTENVACPRRSDSRARAVSAERVKLCTGKMRRKNEAWGGGEREKPVNILKGSFYTGFQYTLLLVDYDTFC